MSGYCSSPHPTRRYLRRRRKRPGSGRTSTAGDKHGMHLPAAPTATARSRPVLLQRMWLLLLLIQLPSSVQGAAGGRRDGAGGVIKGVRQVSTCRGGSGGGGARAQGRAPTEAEEAEVTTTAAGAAAAVAAAVRGGGRLRGRGWGRTGQRQQQARTGAAFVGVWRRGKRKRAGELAKAREEEDEEQGGRVVAEKAAAHVASAAAAAANAAAAVATTAAAEAEAAAAVAAGAAADGIEAGAAAAAAAAAALEGGEGGQDQPQPQSPSALSSSLSDLPLPVPGTPPTVGSYENEHEWLSDLSPAGVRVAEAVKLFDGALAGLGRGLTAFGEAVHKSTKGVAGAAAAGGGKGLSSLWSHLYTQQQERLMNEATDTSEEEEAAEPSDDDELRQREWEDRLPFGVQWGRQPESHSTRDDRGGSKTRSRSRGMGRETFAHLQEGVDVMEGDESEEAFESDSSRAWAFWQRVGSIYWSYKQKQMECYWRLRKLPKHSAEYETQRQAFWDEAHELNSDKMLALCLDLKGFYLKAGQFLACRPDFMPEQYCQKLSSLHDDVPPMGGDEIKREIEKALGLKVDEVFEEGSLLLDKPVGSASISQVHEARLKTTGEKVAVKVQYPGAERLMAGDLRNLQVLATLLSRTEMKFDLVGPVKEMRNQIGMEFDFLREGKTMDVLSNLLEEEVPGVKVPRTRLVSKGVLVMTFVEGQPLSVLRRPDEESRLKKRLFFKHKRKLLATLADAWGFMLFRAPRFQGDPHPGNILLMEKMQVGLLDWGQTKHISDEMKRDLAALVEAIGRGDKEEVAQRFLDLGIRVEDPNDIEGINVHAIMMFDAKDVPGVDINPFGPGNGLSKNGITHFPQDLFFVLRSVQMLRGMAHGMGVKDLSLAEAWRCHTAHALGRMRTEQEQEHEQEEEKQRERERQQLQQQLQLQQQQQQQHREQQQGQQEQQQRLHSGSSPFPFEDDERLSSWMDGAASLASSPELSPRRPEQQQQQGEEEEDDDDDEEEEEKEEVDSPGQQQAQQRRPDRTVQGLDGKEERPRPRAKEETPSSDKRRSHRSWRKWGRRTATVGKATDTDTQTERCPVSGEGEGEDRRSEGIGRGKGGPEEEVRGHSSVEREQRQDGDATSSSYTPAAVSPTGAASQTRATDDAPPPPSEWLAEEGEDMD